MSQKNSQDEQLLNSAFPDNQNNQLIQLLKEMKVLLLEIKENGFSKQINDLGSYADSITRIREDIDRLLEATIGIHNLCLVLTNLYKIVKTKDMRSNQHKTAKKQLDILLHSLNQIGIIIPDPFELEKNPFDPTNQQIFDTVESDKNHTEGSIVEIYQFGASVGNHYFQPTLVILAKDESPKEEENNDNQ